MVKPIAAGLIVTVNDMPTRLARGCMARVVLHSRRSIGWCAARRDLLVCAAFTGQQHDVHSRQPPRCCSALADQPEQLATRVG
jgi:hypothetical protein